MLRLLAAGLGLIVFASFSVARSADTWTPNDLSILLPLPQDVGPDPMLRAGTQGVHGVLVPWAAYQSVPTLDMVFRKKEDEYASLRVVAIRIDPCFPAQHGGCRRQIRLVWQPLVSGRAEKPVITIDAGVHTFYELTELEFDRLLKDLSKLKKETGIATEGPLWIHPALVKQGLQGPFLRSLHQIILNYVGEARMSRLTFMLVRGASILWSFGGFDFAQDSVSPIAIPRLELPVFSTQQSFFNSSFSSDDFQRSGLSPAPLGADTYNLLMRDSARIRPKEDQAEIIESLAAIYRIENPDFHSPETMDCVSCHVAQAARGFALNRFGQLAFPESVHALAYKSNFDLTNVSPSAWFTTNLHAFSYFQEEPSISQRVINEAAAVAASLNSRR